MENTETIENKILSIIKDRLKIVFDETISNIGDKPLLGDEIGLNSYELAYLVMEVNKTYNMLIPEEYLLCPGLQTINDFIVAVEKYQNTAK